MAKDLGTELEQLWSTSCGAIATRRSGPAPRPTGSMSSSTSTGSAPPSSLRPAVPTRCCACSSGASCRAGRAPGRAGRSGRRWRRRCSSRRWPSGGVDRRRRRRLAGTRCRAGGRPAVDRAGRPCWPAGFLGVSVPEDIGGSGGTLSDALDVIRGAAYAGASTPVIDGPVLAGWLLASRGLAFPWADGWPCSQPATLAVAQTGAGPVLTGTLTASPGRKRAACWWCRSTETGTARGDRRAADARAGARRRRYGGRAGRSRRPVDGAPVTALGPAALATTTPPRRSARDGRWPARWR